jgi:hypothetical protein
MTEIRAPRVEKHFIVIFSMAKNQLPKLTKHPTQRGTIKFSRGGKSAGA